MRNKMAAGLLLIATLALVGCGSALVTTLEAISIAADVGAPVVTALSPAAAGFVALVPGVVTAALDVADGSAPLSTASTVAAQLQSVWTQGNQLLTGLSGMDKTLVNAILTAIQSGIALWNQTYGTTASQLSAQYTGVMSFAPSTATAKIKKPSEADKRRIANARKHLANIKAALAARGRK